MNNLPNGFLAAHIAELMLAGELTSAAAIARYLGIGEIRARQIEEHAQEKITNRALGMFPRPNHENHLKEWNR